MYSDTILSRLAEYRLLRKTTAEDTQHALAKALAKAAESTNAANAALDEDDDDVTVVICMNEEMLENLADEISDTSDEIAAEAAVDEATTVASNLLRDLHGIKTVREGSFAAFNGGWCSRRFSGSVVRQPSSGLSPTMESVLDAIDDAACAAYCATFAEVMDNFASTADDELVASHAGVSSEEWDAAFEGD